MSSDVMLDIETLSILPNATILTIGAQGFDPFSNRFTSDTYYERITLESQPNRHIDDGTVEWWSKQDQAAQDEAFGEEGRIDLKPALEKLAKILFHADRLWANGTTFDMVILENAYREHNLPLPWEYWKVMDARTVYSLVNKRGKLGNGHHALGDCVNQITLLQECLREMGIKSF